MMNTEETLQRGIGSYKSQESVLELDLGMCPILDRVWLWPLSIWVFRIIQLLYKNMVSFQLVRGRWDFFPPFLTSLLGGIL